MAWRKRTRAAPLPDKCNRCVRGHTTRIYVADQSYVQVFCARCRRQMSDLELMRPPIARVK